MKIGEEKNLLTKVKWGSKIKETRYPSAWATQGFKEELIMCLCGECVCHYGNYRDIGKTAGMCWICLYHLWVPVDFIAPPYTSRVTKVNQKRAMALYCNSLKFWCKLSNIKCFLRKSLQVYTLFSYCNVYWEMMTIIITAKHFHYLLMDLHSSLKCLPHLAVTLGWGSSDIISASSREEYLICSSQIFSKCAF